jgi:stage II sporulation protein D
MYKLFLFSIVACLGIIITGCSSSRRSYERENKFEKEEGTLIRVLLNEQEGKYDWHVESPVYLSDADNELTLIHPGNSLSVSNSRDEININVGGKNFRGREFYLAAAEKDSSLNYNGSNYKGTLKIIRDGSEIRVLNVLSLEQYLKGVVPYEMPSANRKEYYEALKAFTICARTYTISKLNENKNTFDVYSDTRDQVYGGCGRENEALNKIVDETRGLILTYDGKPAITLYHSTCGGYTEDAANVFTKINAPYLRAIKDGEEPYCTISPKFTWTENFDEQDFIRRFVSAGYLDNHDYTFQSATINSLFRSGRINELQLNFSDRNNNLKTVKLYGNNIRYVIRTADNKSILESNNFDIKAAGDRHILIKGKGYGHGVGLCQWGALAQSKQGKTYQEILSFYYPGTKIESLND